MTATTVAPVGPSSPTGHTTVAAVIGDPVRHSLSPALHNAGFRAAGLDWVYVAFAVAAGLAPAALDAMRALRLGGLSVTMPHKEAVAEALAGRLSRSAAQLGAVNCVRRDDDGVTLVGENTDGAGFVDSLRIEAGVDPAGANVVLFGAGGAGRAVAAALADAGVDRLVVVNRSRERAERAVALVGARATVGDESAVKDADIVVNSTSVGMGAPSPAASLPFPTALLHARLVVADLVYQPLETPLLSAAKVAGARTVNGVGMLLHQACHAFTHWTGQPAPVAAMREAVLTQLSG